MLSFGIYGSGYGQTSDLSATESPEIKLMLSYDSIGRSLAYRVPDSSIYYMTKALEIAKEKEM